MWTTVSEAHVEKKTVRPFHFGMNESGSYYLIDKRAKPTVSLPSNSCTDRRHVVLHAAALQPQLAIIAEDPARPFHLNKLISRFKIQWNTEELYGKMGLFWRECTPFRQYFGRLRLILTYGKFMHERIIYVGPFISYPFWLEGEHRHMRRTKRHGEDGYPHWEDDFSTTMRSLANECASSKNLMIFCFKIKVHSINRNVINRYSHLQFAPEIVNTPTAMKSYGSCRRACAVTWILNTCEQLPPAKPVVINILSHIIWRIVQYRHAIR